MSRAIPAPRNLKCITTCKSPSIEFCPRAEKRACGQNNQPTLRSSPARPRGACGRRFSYRCGRRLGRAGAKAERRRLPASHFNRRLRPVGARDEMLLARAGAKSGRWRLPASHFNRRLRLWALVTKCSLRVRERIPGGGGFPRHASIVACALWAGARDEMSLARAGAKAGRRRLPASHFNRRLRPVGARDEMSLACARENSEWRRLPASCSDRCLRPVGGRS